MALIPMIRIAATALLGLGSAVAAAKAAAKNQVEKKKASVVEAAYARARAEIRGKTEIYLKSSLEDFMRITAIKAALLASLFLLYLAGAISNPTYRVLLLIALIGLGVWDIVRNFSTLRILVERMRRHKMNAKRAISEIVTAQIFDTVMEEASAVKPAWRDSAIMALAGTRHSALSREISEAVSVLAGQTSWADIKPFVITAAWRAGLVLGIYSIVVWSLVALS